MIYIDIKTNEQVIILYKIPKSKLVVVRRLRDNVQYKVNKKELKRLFKKSW